MKEYTAQEMKDNPITGWYWIRGEEDTVYADGFAGIRIFFDGWRYVSTIPSYRVPLKDVSDDIVFYGPIEKPEVPE
ncbi:hypothetical protein KA005_67875 [bacterium]|nr:hypothetical protein [bacterium]